MRSLKPLISIIQAIVPIAYCGGLLYYFFDVAGSVENAKETGLWPTLLGLGIVGLFFTVVFVIKFVWIFMHWRSQGPRHDTPPDDGGFDADAAIARYKSRQASEPERSPPTAPPPHRGGGNARSFGRKIR